ncbi:hypothetical protein SCG7086_AE_00230 [Chlamydiales bacterium SCGC AG-110-P3]|nr:hypothetical protein SCG7086_AE_00230 [Chlamydiales bacterium SCGC AG-110-P3]
MNISNEISTLDGEFPQRGNGVELCNSASTGTLAYNSTGLSQDDGDLVSRAAQAGISSLDNERYFSDGTQMTRSENSRYSAGNNGPCNDGGLMFDEAPLGVARKCGQREQQVGDGRVGSQPHWIRGKMQRSSNKWTPGGKCLDRKKAFRKKHAKACDQSRRRAHTDKYKDRFEIAERPHRFGLEANKSDSSDVDSSASWSGTEPHWKSIYEDWVQFERMKKQALYESWYGSKGESSSADLSVSDDCLDPFSRSISNGISSCSSNWSGDSGEFYSFTGSEQSELTSRGDMRSLLNRIGTLGLGIKPYDN